MPIEIKLKSYISPREAFEIVGQESFGQVWDTSIIEIPESEQFKICLSNLYKAFSSGEVSIFTTYGNDSPRSLHPIDTRGHFFTIDLEKNVVLNERTMPYGEHCEINAGQLRDFVRRHDPTRPVSSPVGKAEALSKEWLINLMSTNEPLAKKPQLKEEAKRRFGTGPVAFDRAWQTAIEKTKRLDLIKAGRPKKSLSE